MKKQFLIYLVFIFSFFSHGQKLQIETITPVSGLKLEYAEMTISSTNEENQNRYLSIQGVFTTDASWKKKNITLKTEARSWGSIANVIEQEIELLPLSKKSFSIYCKPIRYNYYGNFDVYVDGNNIYHSNLQIENNEQIYYNILYISPGNYSNTDYLRPIINSVIKERDTQGYYWQENIISLKYLSASKLPESWIAYKNIDLVIINSDRPFIDVNSTNDKRLLALKHWLYMGGEVIVSSGSTLWPTSSVFMQGLFDVDSIKITATKIQDNILPGKNLYIDGEIYQFPHEKQQAALKDSLWHIPVGQGKLHYSGVDIGKYGGNQDFKAFWSDYALKDLRVNRYQKKNFLYDSDVDIKQRDFAKDRTPILWLVSLLVIVYLLTVGPLNFSFLKKRGKSIYLVLTIPLIAIIFSGMLLLYGFLSKGVTNTAKRVSFVHHLGKNSYYVKDYYVLSSGSRNLYSVDGGEDSVSYILEREEYENIVYYKQNKNTIKLVDFPLNLWEIGFFGMEKVTTGPELQMSMPSKELDLSFPTELGIINAYVFGPRFIHKLDSGKSTHSLDNNTIGSKKTAKRVVEDCFGETLPSSLVNLVVNELSWHTNRQGKNVLVAFLNKEFSSFTTEPEAILTDEVHVLIAYIDSESK